MRHPLRRQDRLRARDLERLRPQVPRVSFDRLRHRLQAQTPVPRRPLADRMQALRLHIRWSPAIRLTMRAARRLLHVRQGADSVRFRLRLRRRRRRISASLGDDVIDIKCADPEPMRACADAALQLFDRLRPPRQ
jgi:hypothetical protein